MRETLLNPGAVMNGDMPVFRGERGGEDGRLRFRGCSAGTRRSPQTLPVAKTKPTAESAYWGRAAPGKYRRSGCLPPLPAVPVASFELFPAVTTMSAVIVGDEAEVPRGLSLSRSATRASPRKPCVHLPGAANPLRLWEEACFGSRAKGAALHRDQHQLRGHATTPVIRQGSPARLFPERFPSGSMSRAGTSPAVQKAYWSRIASCLWKERSAETVARLKGGRGIPWPGPEARP